MPNHVVSCSKRYNHHEISYKAPPGLISVACKQIKKQGEEVCCGLSFEEKDSSLKVLRTIGKASRVFIQSLILKSSCKLAISLDSPLISSQPILLVFYLAIPRIRLFCLILITQFFDLGPVHE